MLISIHAIIVASLIPYIQVLYETSYCSPPTIRPSCKYCSTLLCDLTNTNGDIKWSYKGEIQTRFSNKGFCSHECQSSFTIDRTPTQPNVADQAHNHISSNLACDSASPSISSILNNTSNHHAYKMPDDSANSTCSVEDYLQTEKQKYHSPVQWFHDSSKDTINITSSCYIQCGQMLGSVTGELMLFKNYEDTDQGRDECIKQSNQLRHDDGMQKAIDITTIIR